MGNAVFPERNLLQRSIDLVEKCSDNWGIYWGFICRLNDLNRCIRYLSLEEKRELLLYCRFRNKQKRNGFVEYVIACLFFHRKNKMFLARKYGERSIASGYPFASNLLGCIEWDAQNHDKAIHYFQQGAALHFPYSIYNLASMHNQDKNHGLALDLLNSVIRNNITELPTQLELAFLLEKDRCLANLSSDTDSSTIPYCREFVDPICRDYMSDTLPDI